MYTDLDSIPLKLLTKILYDERNIHLLGGDNTKEVWLSIKKEYEEQNPTREEGLLVGSSNKVQLTNVKINTLVILLNFCLEDTDEIKEMFNKSGVKWIADVTERYEYITKNIDKETQKLKIYKAQYLKLEKSIKDQPKEEKNELKLSQINDSLASLEINNIPIGDYDLVTYGRYNSLTKMINKKANKHG